MGREDGLEYLRRAVHEAVLATSLRDVALEVGVSHTTIRDFIRGSTPSERTLYRLGQWYSKKRGWEDEGGPAGGAEDAAVDLFRDFDQVARMLGGLGAPGQAKERKLAGIEALERAAVTFDWRLPDWWWSLRRKVENGEI